MPVIINGTNGISGADGSAATPALQGTDTNTGVYFPAADTVAVATNGSGRLFINSTGQVGIGVSSPGQPLDVNGTIRTQNGQFYGMYTGTAPGSLLGGLDFYGNGTGVTGEVQIFARLDSGSITSSHLEFLTSSSGTLAEKARLTSDGKWLVGTSSAPANGAWAPNSKLQSIGNTDGTNSAAVLTLGIARSAATVVSGNDIGVITFTGNDGYEFGRIQCQADAAAGSGDYPGRLVFSTTSDGASSPTERMRINSGGSQVFYMDNNYDCFNIRSASAAGTSIYYYDGRYGATGPATGGTRSYVVWTNGNVQNTNNSYTAISDIKLKENIVDANSQWNDLKSLRVRNYNLKEGQTHRQIGLIAQEVEPISPGLVYESPDRDAEGNDLGTVTKSVNYSVLYMKAVKALQEAMERIEQLEAEMAEVKAQLS